MSPRPVLPASSSDFALSISTPSSSTLNTSATNTPLPSPSEEIAGLMMLRFRRPSLLAPVRPGTLQDGRLQTQSPLATTSFTFPLSRRYSTSIKDDVGDESESDKDKMSTDSPPSVDSGATTPSLNSDPSEKSSLRADSDSSTKSAARPITPPQSTPTKPPAELSSEAIAQMKLRRLSHPVRSIPIFRYMER